MIDSVPRQPPVIVLPDLSVPWSIPAGWHLHPGFVLPDQPWDLSSRQFICHGPIAGDADAVAAVTALTRGTGLAVSLTLTGGPGSACSKTFTISAPSPSSLRARTTDSAPNTDYSSMLLSTEPPLPTRPAD